MPANRDVSPFINLVRTILRGVSKIYLFIKLVILYYLFEL